MNCVVSTFNIMLMRWDSRFFWSQPNLSNSNLRILPRNLSIRGYDSYLVDSASSHMLVSKIKPCMSKYKQLYCETANGSLNQLSFI